MSSISAATGEFGLDLFKGVLGHNAQNNIFFSPLTIAAALGMVYYGTRGDTATQLKERRKVSADLMCLVACDGCPFVVMEGVRNSGNVKDFEKTMQVLHFNKVRSATAEDSSATEHEHNTATGSQCDQPGGIHSQFQALLSQLNKPTKDYVLSTANRLYGAVGFKILPHYLHCLEELYHAGLETVDFAKATEKTILQINDWVAGQTHGKIKEFYPPHSLSPDSVLVLVNAVYFKGMWASRFKEEDTKEAPFWVNKNESKSVPTMSQSGEFKIANLEDPPVQVLELPYEGKNLSMFILLPKDEDVSSLKKLENSLTYENLEEWTNSSKMSLWPVNLKLPKFKLEEEYDLKEVLKLLGINLLFDTKKVDLSGMSQEHLVESQITHKSFVEVNELGTEAGAATGVGITTTSAKVPEKFMVDHPFFFFIKDVHSNSIIFLGKVSSP